jgi:hypothetical protein
VQNTTPTEATTSQTDTTSAPNTGKTGSSAATKAKPLKEADKDKTTQDAAVAARPIEWKETDPTMFTIYARGSAKSDINDKLGGKARVWANMEAHPLGMSMTIASRDDFRDSAAYDAVRGAASLFFDADRTINDTDEPGTIHVWPQSEKNAEGKFVPVARWANRSLTNIAELFLNKKARFGIELKWKGTAVLVAQIAGEDYATAIDIVKKHQLVCEKTSVPSVTTAVLTVTTTRQAFGTAYDAVMRERRELEEKYPTLRWGDPDPMFVGYRTTVMIPTDLTIEDAYTRKTDTYTARFMVTPPLIGKEHDAVNTDLVKTAVAEAADGRRTDIRRHIGMGEAADEADSDDSQDEINEAELERYNVALTKLLTRCSRVLSAHGLDADQRKVILKEAAAKLPFDTEFINKLNEDGDELLKNPRDVFNLLREFDREPAPTPAEDDNNTTEPPTPAWLAIARAPPRKSPVSFYTNTQKPRKSVIKKDMPARNPLPSSAPREAAKK